MKLENFTKLCLHPMDQVFPMIRNGKNIKQGNSNIGFPITRIETISEGVVNTNKVGYAGLSKADCKDYMLQEGDILFSHINSISHLGKTAIYKESMGPLVHGMNLLCLRSNHEKYDSQYLIHTLKNPFFKHSLSKSIKPAVNQASISINDLKQVSIPVPDDIEEQRRIAAILDKADAVRKKRQQSLDMLDDLLRATFLDMFGDPVTNPKDWPVEQLSDHISFLTSGSRGWAKYYADEGDRFIRSLDVRMNYLGDNDPAFVNAPDSAEANRTRVEPGDVLLTITGSKIGRACPMPPNKGIAYISQHVALMRLRDTLNPIYLSMFLSEPAGGQRQINRMQYGQTKPGLNLEQIRCFQIPRPDISRQRDFAQIAAAAAHTKTNLQMKFDDADNLFASISQRAFKGEL